MEESLIKLIVDLGVGGSSLVILYLLLSNFMKSSQRDREISAEANKTLVATISNQIDLNRKVVERNNDLVERNNDLINDLKTVLAQGLNSVDSNTKSLAENFKKSSVEMNDGISKLRDGVLQLEPIIGGIINQQQTGSDAANKIKEQISTLTQLVSEYKYQIIHGLLILDNSLNLVAFNESAIKLLGDRDNLNGLVAKPSLAIYPDGTPIDYVQLPFVKAMREKASIESTIIGIHDYKGTGRKWISLSVNLMHNLNNEVQWIIVGIKDAGLISFVPPKTSVSSTEPIKNM